MEVLKMIAEMRINGKPVEPKIIKETENSLSCKGTNGNSNNPINYKLLPFAE